MILIVDLSPTALTVGLATPAGDLERTQDATWRVGSGRSLATAVDELLADQPQGIKAISRLLLIDRGGSYTTARTAYAYVNALAWIRQLPTSLVRTTPDRFLAELVQKSIGEPPQSLPLLPHYEPIN